MKMRAKIKIGLDMVMTILLLLQMGYHMFAEGIHKWIGIILSVLFVFHYVLNWMWYKSIFKGKYAPARMFRTVTNILLTLSMFGMMLSGLMLARDIFHFIPFRANSFARLLHMSATSWGFVLAALHMGQHFSIVVGKLKRRDAIKKPVWWSLRCVVAGISGYGWYTFIKREIGKHMFLTVQFAFFEFGEPFIRFLLDYTAIMVLYAAIAYYFLKLLTMWGKKKMDNGK